MRVQILGIVSLVLLTIAIIPFVRDAFNFSPLLMGELVVVTGYVSENKITPQGKGVVHKVTYYYSYDGQQFSADHYSNAPIARLMSCDSLFIKISKKTPEKSQIEGFYHKKKVRK